MERFISPFTLLGGASVWPGDGSRRANGASAHGRCAVRKEIAVFCVRIQASSLHLDCEINIVGSKCFSRADWIAMERRRRDTLYVTQTGTLWSGTGVKP